MSKSNDGILLIKSWQLYIVSRYVTGMKVAYFDHNKELRPEIIERIRSCGLVFVGTLRIIVYVYFYYTQENRW